ncbi:hypothetical protein Axi01nite_71700 [Actinoplanes xinjiangensis]|nr:hypothetical protein Axi01nite_71700 [Actinoplanes xinjiangensis]
MWSTASRPCVSRPASRPRKQPAKLHGDKGYDYRACRQALTQRGIKTRIARKGIESSTRLGRHRNVIERYLEWGHPVPASGPPLRPQGFPLPRIPAPGLRCHLLPPRGQTEPVDE